VSGQPPRRAAPFVTLPVDVSDNLPSSRPAPPKKLRRRPGAPGRPTIALGVLTVALAIFSIGRLVAGSVVWIGPLALALIVLAVLVNVRVVVVRDRRPPAPGD
jgi:hypothetical protein